MTRKVLVTIQSLRMLDVGNGESRDETIEVAVPADYFFRNGKHYIRYDEVTEGFSRHTENQIRICDGPTVEVKKKGLVNSVMVFGDGQVHKTRYGTPFGTIELGVVTDRVTVEESPERIGVRIVYELEADGSAVVGCDLRITVRPREEVSA